MEEIATSPFGRSKGVFSGRLWEVQYHCVSFLHFNQGSTYFTLWEVKGVHFGRLWDVQYQCFAFLFRKEILSSLFGSSKRIPFGRLWEVQYQ